MISDLPLTDIAVNLGNRQFAGDVRGVLQRARDAGVTTCVLTGTSPGESAAVLELQQQWEADFPGMLWTTAGIHPHHADEFSADSVGLLAELARHPAVRAIGETGLDFNRDFTPRPVQEKAFCGQLELAAGSGLPAFMHERDAWPRQHDILRDYRDHLADGVIHCFTGTREALYSYLDMDLHIGITGWICDERRGRELQELVAAIPLDRLMIETDAPFLLPRTIEPRPASRRNEPAYLPWVLDTVARCRQQPIEEVARATRDNAARFFRLPSPG